QEVGGGEHVVHLAEEALLLAGVVVAAAQRREHHHQAGLAEGAGRLVVARRPLLPAALVDGVAVAAGDPDDRRVLLAVAGVGRQVGRQLADRGVVADGAEYPRRRRGRRLGGAAAADELGLEALAGLGQRPAARRLRLGLATAGEGRQGQ